MLASMNAPGLDGPLLSGIPAFAEVDQLEPLTGGFSLDEKYLALRNGVARYVLRLGDAELLPRKESESRALADLRRVGLLCPEPIDVGLTDDGSRFFTVVTYIDGVPARDVIRNMTPEQQANAGHMAGEQLRIIHSHTPELPVDGWQDRRIAKHRRKLASLGRRELTFEGRERVANYVDANWALIDTAPFRLQHDDFQLGNIIMAGDEFAGVIDFGNWDGGDPIEDFYKVPWLTEPLSIAFTLGQVEGYLGPGVPANFWPRYNLFVALSLYSSLLWGDETGFPLEAEMERHVGPLDSWRAGIARIMETHDFEGGGPPSWFAR